MTSCWPKKSAPGTQRRVTLAELMIVAAILGILASIAIPLHANAQARARIEQAQSDLQMLALGVRKFTDHMGTLPATLAALTAQATNGSNQSAGPFVGSIPVPPPGGLSRMGRLLHLYAERGRQNVLHQRDRRRHDHHRAIGSPLAGPLAHSSGGSSGRASPSCRTRRRSTEHRGRGAAPGHQRQRP
jgi:type II secretory pathway pseudopilin PulG